MSYIVGSWFWRAQQFRSIISVRHNNILYLSFTTRKTIYCKLWLVIKRFARPFSKGTEERNHDLARVYREYFEHSVHPGNLAAFIDSYVRRTDLGISRSTPTSESCPAGRRLSMATTLQMPIINVCGALSPHQEDTVTLNSRLDPTKSSWMKVSPPTPPYV